MRYFDIIFVGCGSKILFLRAFCFSSLYKFCKLIPFLKSWSPFYNLEEFPNDEWLVPLSTWSWTAPRSDSRGVASNDCRYRRSRCPPIQFQDLPFNFSTLMIQNPREKRWGPSFSGMLAGHYWFSVLAKSRERNLWKWCYLHVIIGGHTFWIPVYEQIFSRNSS